VPQRCGRGGASARGVAARRGSCRAAARSRKTRGRVTCTRGPAGRTGASDAWGAHWAHAQASIIWWRHPDERHSRSQSTVHPPTTGCDGEYASGAFTTSTEVSHVVLVASNDAQRHSSCAAAADAAGGGWRATTRRARLSGGAAACATAARAWRCHCAGRHRAVRLVSGCGALTEDQRQGH
jgi:hypothetical protein